MTVPDTMTLSEFARHLGSKASYVTQLKHDGRLLLTPDGKRVMVRASLDRIEATRDPARLGVVAATSSPRGQQQADPNTDEDLDPVVEGRTYQESRALKEHYAAMAAKRDYEISTGKLLDADDVRQAIAAAVTTFRATIEARPYEIAASLAAAQDEATVRALLVADGEARLRTLSAEFARIAKEHERTS